METEQAVQSLPEESLQERASREMAELREQYPDAELNPGQMKTLAETVTKEPGIRLAQAYGRWLLDDKDRQIAELQLQVQALEQNQKNQRCAPGSQADSGSSHRGGAFDEFMTGFAD